VGPGLVSQFTAGLGRADEKDEDTSRLPLTFRNNPGMPSQHDTAFDDYFTRQIVGTAEPAVMGPRAGLRQVSDRSPRIEAWGDQLRLIGAAGRSIWARSPAQALAGDPLPLARIPRWRKRLLLGALAGWSVTLCLSLWALFHWVVQA
jgi:hypothetical protein